MNSKIFNFEYCGLKISSIPNLFSFERHLKGVWRSKDRKCVIFGYSMSIFPRVRDNPRLINYNKSFDIILSDGTLFHGIGKLSGFPFKHMISVPQAVIHIIQMLKSCDKTLMIIGAKDNVLKKAEKKLIKTGLNILPGLDGYFDKTNELNIVNHINKYNPDTLLIGMPTPKKEKFIHDYKKIINAKVIVLCGGMIDVIAEEVTLAHPIVKKMGLAGFYRVLQEPNRLGIRILTFYIKIIFYYLPVLTWSLFVLNNSKFSFFDKRNIPK